jgi:Fe-Mn family superoxide dismutase
MLFNNHFFFSGLSGNPAPMGGELRRDIELCFGTVENLRREMLVTALGMFGPGFVWLVRVHDKRMAKNSAERASARYDFRVLPTYLAGSPFAEAHWRRQTTDMNTAGEAQWRQGPHAGLQMAAYQTPTTRQQLSQAGADADRTPPGGTNIVPVLCLNTWEHVWLTDYGIGDGKRGGKEEYIQRWWRAVDWNQVSSLINPSRKVAV